MRQSLFVLFFLASSPVTSGLAASLAQLDQSHAYPGGLRSTVAAAQTFTVGMKGILDRVEVPIQTFADTTPGSVTEYWMQLLRTEDNDGILTNMNARRVALKYFNAPPTGAVYDAPWSQGGFHWISLDNLALPVDVGDKFAITFSMDSHSVRQFFWIATFPGPIFPRGGEPYPGGKPWTVNEQGWFYRDTAIEDLAFRTFVVPVPEPTAAFLAGGALLSFAALRRRK